MNENWMDLVSDNWLEEKDYEGREIETSQLQHFPACCTLVYDLESGHNELFENPGLYYNGVIVLLETLMNNFKGRAFQCIINEIVNLTSVACILSVCEGINHRSKLKFCDMYLRVRHEIFFELCCKYLRQTSETSDQKFSDFFPISSNKTPDRIFRKENLVGILEVTVTTRVEQAAFQKGGLGYTPKYTKEMDTLVVLGYDVKYCVCILDASDSSNKDYLLVLDDLANHMQFDKNSDLTIDFDYYQAEIVSIQKFLSRFYVGELSSLFSEPYLLEPKLNSKVKGMMSKSTGYSEMAYVKLTVNTEIYNKIVFRWNRLSTYLNRFKMDDKVTLYYDYLSPNLRFKLNRKGSTVKNWINALDKDDRLFCVQNTITELAGAEKKLTESEKGIQFFSLQTKPSKSSVVNHTNFRNFSQIHPFGFWDPKCGVEEEMEEFEDWDLPHSVYEDPKYEDKLLSLIKQWDESPKFDLISKSLLCNCENNEETSKNALDLYEKKLYASNDMGVSIPIKLYKHKNSFAYPVANLCQSNFINFRTKATTFLQGLLSHANLPKFSRAIIGKATLDSFDFGSMIDPRLFESEYQVLRSNYIEANLKYHKEAKILAKQMDLNKIPNKAEFLLLKPESKKWLEELNEKKRIFDKYVDVKKLPRQKLPLLKFNTRSKNSIYKNMFKEEVSHLKEKGEQSKISGVGMSLHPENAYAEQTSLYNGMKDFLLAPSFNAISDDVLDPNSYDDVLLLKHFKEEHIKDIKPCLNKLKGSNLYNACAFVSRLCHSLMYYSQCSFNSDYVAVDNLGIDNCLLIVKGGKKIFRTKQTKIFKLLYPIDESYKNYLTDDQTSSSKSFWMNGQLYLESPWMFFKEALVSEGICFLHKLSGFILMNWNPSNTFFESVNASYFNAYLAFHSKRKTEEFMHGFRYLLVNNMGEFSNLSELLPEFAEFNYDFVQLYLRLCLSNEYLNLTESLRRYKGCNDLNTALQDSELKHIFNSHQIKSLEDLSRYIYSSYLMVKAPINQMTEQLKNMKSLMQTHEVAMKELGDNEVIISENDTLEDYTSRLFKSDFNYDPYLCTLMGKFLGDFLMSKNTKSEIHKIWESCLNKNWDSLANSKGLRGDIKSTEFFGEKGYYVVCKDLIKKGKLDDAISIINEESDDYTKKSKLAKLNETFRSECKDNIEELIFHVVDKRQRGGSREIYVMDLSTKLHQQPLEAFIAKLCKMVPNELISIPSNKRLQTIHSQVFERGVDLGLKENYYLTLDCRKWAPKSNIDKYVLFILGMSNVLPKTFLKHFLNFFSLMYGKKNVTRLAVMQNFLKNESNKKYAKWFETQNDAAYFKMPYSFMMGIFNFLSSLMHASNQMYMSYIINLSSKNNLNVDSYLHMMAHSDDSAGKAIVQSKNDMRRLILLYEIGLKSANHLISIKKSVVSKVYFEFLSVLYLMNQLVPLLPKFMSGISFRPADKGYCSDAMQSYSKCIELILNGAHFEQAYIYMKVQSHLIWKFYFNENPKIDDYLIPPQLGGMPDAHPLSIMLIGTDSDLLRLKYSYGEEFAGTIMKFANLMLVKKSADEGLLQSFNAKPNIRPTKNMFIDSVNKIQTNLSDFSSSWTINNMTFKNTSLNLLQIILKTKDSTFLAALQDEEIIRRISRAYYFRTTACVETKLGFMTYKQLRKIFNAVSTLRFIKKEELDIGFVFKAAGIEVTEESILMMQTEIKEESVILSRITSVLYTEVVKYYNYMNKIRLNPENAELKYKTSKPVHMNILRTSQPLSNVNDIASIITWMKEPQYRYLLSNVSGLETASKILETYLADSGLDFHQLDCAMAYKMARKIFLNSEKDYYFYSNMPTNCREINNYQDVCLMLAHNSKKDTYYTGLNIPFSRSPGVLLGDYMPTVNINEFVETTAYLSLIIAAYATDHEKTDLLNELEWALPSFLGSSSVNIQDLITKLNEYWKPSQVCYGYLQTYLNFSNGLINGDIIVDNAKKVVGNMDFINKGYYYVYVKNQKLINNRWLGYGKLLVNTPNGSFLFEHESSRLKKIITTMKKGSMAKVVLEYLNMVFSESRLQTLQSNFRYVSDESTDFEILGIDRNGVVCLDHPNHLEFGFENTELRDSLYEMSHLKNIRAAKLESNGSLIISHGDEFSSVQKWRINFYPLDMAAVSKHIMTLFASPEDSLKNYRLASTGTGHFGSFIRSNLLSMFNRPLYISFDHFFSGLRSSRLFDILRHIRSIKPECLENVNSTEAPSGPSPSNGLLNCLVNYKDINSSFKFDTEPLLTEHIMAIKSQQPEQYLSTLTRHMGLMYENLYTSDEKEEMQQEIKEVVQMLISENPKSIQSVNLLMSKWGYSSLVSNLVVFKVHEGDGLHKAFLRENLNPSLMNVLKSKIISLNYALYHTFKENRNILPEVFVDKTHYDLGYNFDSFESNFYSYIALMDYWRAANHNIIGSNKHLLGQFISQCLFMILNNSHLNKTFKDHLSNDDIFMHLRFTPKDWEEWTITWMACLQYYTTANQMKIIGNPLLGSNYDKAESYNKAKVFDYGNKLTFNSFKNWGFFCNQFKELLRKKIHHNDHYYYPVFKNFKGSVPVFGDFTYEGPIHEDVFEEDAWEDFFVEMTTDYTNHQDLQISMQSLTDDVGQFYTNPTDRVRGRLYYHQLNIISALYTGKNRLFAGFVRQLGDNVMVICDSYDLDFMNCMNKPRAYKPGYSWKFGLLNRNMAYILVSFRNGIPEGFAECYDLIPASCPIDDTPYKCRLTAGIDVKAFEWIRYKFQEKIKLQSLMEEESKMIIEKSLKETGESQNQEEEEQNLVHDINLKNLMNDCKKEGLSEQSASMMAELIIQSKGETKDQVSGIIEKILTDSLKNKDLMKILKNQVSDIVMTKIKNRAQLETIMQVPLMLQKGSRNEKTRSNIHFRDEQVRAEIDSISSNLTDKIVSGTLTITHEERDEMLDIIELCDGYTAKSHEHPESSIFIMLTKLILNDAFVVSENTHEHMVIWKNIRRKLVSKVVKPKGRLFVFDDPLKSMPTGANLNYKFAGFPDD